MADEPSSGSGGGVDLPFISGDFLSFSTPVWGKEKLEDSLVRSFGASLALQLLLTAESEEFGGLDSEEEFKFEV